MERVSTIRRRSRTPDDDVVIQAGYSFCDILMISSIIFCVLSFLAAPVLIGLIAVPALKEYLNIHSNHEDTTCTIIVPENTTQTLETNTGNTTAIMKANTTSYMDQMNVTDIDYLSLSTTSPNVTINQTVNTNVTGNLNVSDSNSFDNDTTTNNPHLNCDKKLKYKCTLLTVVYQDGVSSVEAKLYYSYRDFIKTRSLCSVYGCGLKKLGEEKIEYLKSLKDGFKCFYDKKYSTRVFLKKEPLITVVAWFISCTVLLLFGFLPFVAFICAKVKTPCQIYFQHCTKRYTSRHEKWIDAIKEGNIFILRWSMSQRHINEELEEVFYKTGFKWRAVPLSRAAYTGQCKVASYFLERGAFTNYEDRLRLTPIHYACLGAKVNTLQFLISQGASLEVKDRSNRTPLLLSLMLNISAPDIIQCLIDAGANVSVEDKHKCTPLHYACFKGDIHMVYMIIKAGGISHHPVYLAKSTFRSELEEAPFGSCYGFVSDLYTNTWTPLASLLYRNNKEACKLLVAAGYKLKMDPILPRVLYSDADESMNRFLKQEMREVTSLIRQCRAWIRHRLGTRKLQQKISNLKLAAPLLEYLRLDRIS